MLRYKICVLFLFIVGICSSSFVLARDNSLPLFGKVIYIDPGHGRYYYAKTNISMLRLDNTVKNDIIKYHFLYSIIK